MIATEPLIRDQKTSTVQDGIDASTGLPGESFWRLVLAAESARCGRYGRAATVVLVAVVGLDHATQAWGPGVADTIAIKIARLLRSGTRTSDHVARLGDARFGILLTETAEVAAINMVERARDRCEQELSGLAPRVGVAFGWASPSSSGTLLRSAITAEARLRRDAARVLRESG
jgi:diguanylate cyclase (GGDEF)-like protein